MFMIIIGILITLVVQGLLYVFFGDFLSIYLAEITDIGIVTKVENKDRKFNAANEYLHFRVIKDGEIYDKLLTENQFESIQDRVNKNQEDIPL